MLYSNSILLLLLVYYLQVTTDWNHYVDSEEEDEKETGFDWAKMIWCGHACNPCVVAESARRIIVAKVAGFSFYLAFSAAYCVYQSIPVVSKLMFVPLIIRSRSTVVCKERWGGDGGRMRDFVARVWKLITINVWAQSTKIWLRSFHLHASHLPPRSFSQNDPWAESTSRKHNRLRSSSLLL
jgi:hypothetical protein